MNEYGVGDYVRVIDSGCVHARYEDWAVEHIQRPFIWMKEERPIKEEVYQITAIGEASPNSGNYKLYALSDVEQNTYIMSRSGFVRFEFQTILKEMDTFFDFGRPLREGEEIPIHSDPETLNTFFALIKKIMCKEGVFKKIKEEYQPWRPLIEKLDMYLDFSEPVFKGEVIRIRNIKKANDLFAKLKEAIK